jgi:hypothetical protein
MRTCGRTVQAGATQTGFQDTPEQEHQRPRGCRASDKAAGGPAYSRGLSWRNEIVLAESKGCAVRPHTIEFFSSRCLVDGLPGGGSLVVPTL